MNNDFNSQVELWTEEIVPQAEVDDQSLTTGIARCLECRATMPTIQRQSISLTVKMVEQLRQLRKRTEMTPITPSNWSMLSEMLGFGLVRIYKHPFAAVISDVGREFLQGGLRLPRVIVYDGLLPFVFTQVETRGVVVYDRSGQRLIVEKSGIKPRLKNAKS